MSSIKKQLITEYWVQKLTGLKRYEVEKSQSTSTHKVIINQETLKYFSKLTAQSEKSEFVVFLTVFGALIQRYFENNSFVYSKNSFFTNETKGNTSLIYKANYSNKTTLKQSIQNVKLEVQQTYKYCDYSKKQLQSIIGSQLFDGYTPFEISYGSDTSKNPNPLFLIHIRKQVNNDFEICLTHSEDFEKKSVSIHFLRNYRRWIENLETYMNQPVIKIPILSETEVKELDEVQKPTVGSSDSNKSTIVQLFEKQVQKTPKNIALVFQEKTFTYQQINEQVNQLASYLKKHHGISSNELIGVKLKRSPQLVVAIFAILKSGAAYVPIDIEHPDHRINYIKKDCNFKVTIDEEFLFQFSKTKVKYSIKNPVQASVLENLAYVMYTSGTTGKPKGVIIKHKNITSLIRWAVSEFSSSNFDVVYASTSHCFDLSIFEMFYPLTIGKKIRVLEDALEIANWLKKDTRILLNTVPTVIRKLLNDKSADTNKITVLNSAGEAFPIDIANRLPKSDMEVRNLYGPTEDTTYSTFYKLLDRVYKRNIPIGKPIRGTSVYILDKNFQRLPKEVAGKLFLGGDGIANGYLNLPDLTAEKFIKNPFNSQENLYDTGDIVKLLEDGNIEFIGREDTQVKLRGYRIELAEIENWIAKFSSDIEQNVLSLVEAENDKKLVSYYVGKRPIDKSSLREYLNTRLPAYMVPSIFVELPKIPLTANGKIDRKSLPQIGEEDMERKKYRAPTNVFERQLIKIWERILNLNKIGIDEDFFELGGHSLMISQVINDVHQIMGKKITYKMFFSDPTIEGISKKVSSKTFSKIRNVPESFSYPVTPSQYRLWFLSKFEGGGRAYQISGGVKIRGNTNLDNFIRAFHHVINRHEVLRTYFKSNEQGILRQHIIPKEDFEFTLPIKDFTQSKNPDKEVETYIQEFNKKEIVLAIAPLFNAVLFLTGPSDLVFFLSIHHIISDGRSLEILTNEVIKSYCDLESGEAPTLDPMSIQFKDYAVWLKELDNKNFRQQAEQYWLNVFKGELPVLALPSYKKRPLVKTYSGNTLVHQFTSDLYSKLTRFSKKHHVTLFMTLFSGVNVLLSRYTNQKDIVVGIPTAGREHPDLESQIGLYFNILAIRSQFEEKDRFSDVLSREKQLLLEAHFYQAYPFDRLVEQLNVKRDTSRSPLFDVMVMFQNPNEISGFHGRRELEQLQIEKFNTPKDVSQFDITFTFIEKEDLSLEVSYNSDIYEPSFIKGICSHLDRLFHQVLESPDISLKDIDLLTRSEKNTLFKEFNNTKLQLDSQKTIVDLFEGQAYKTPNRTALVLDNKKLTYIQLQERSNQLATFLSLAKVKDNTVVALCVDRSFEMIIGILGILKAGAVYLPLDASYPIDRLDYIIENSKAEIILTKEEIKNFLPKSKKIICFENESVWSKEITNVSHVTQEMMAYVMYTSGTTGRPKGVKISHRNLFNFFIGLDNRFKPLRKIEVWLAATSMNFDISILEMLWTLTRGSRVVIQPDRPVVLNALGKMDFGLFYFAAQEEVITENKYTLLLKGADFADKNQFKALWVPERHFHSFGDQFPNPSIAAAAVAALTKNIAIRSGSVVLPLHDPVRVAEEWSMVDNLSEGRVELSIASGWHPNDFVLAPDNYKNRHQIMRDKIAILKDLWRGKPLSRKNGVGEDFQFTIHPKPVQPELNIWITAAGSMETFKYAGSIGANILTHLLGQTTEDLKEKIKLYRRTLKKHGFDPEKGKVAVMLHTFVGDDISQVENVVKKPFKNYLRQSINLMKSVANDSNLDVDIDFEAIVELGYQRYYRTSGLFGDPRSCLNKIIELYNIGINEIACLLDFGIDTETVLENLANLKSLMDLVNRNREQHQFLSKRLENQHSTSKLIKDNNVTHFQSTPSFINELLVNKEGKESLKQIKTLLVGGEAIPVEISNELLHLRGKPFFNMYGPTETTIWSTIKEITQNDIVNIGKPIANTQIYILNSNNQLCPIGVIGELCIGGEGVSIGYVGREDINKEKFFDSPFENFNSQQKIYRTGDLARWLPSGELECFGRIDNQIKIRGNRIELGEIENALRKNENITDSAVGVNLDEFNEKELVAYIVSNHKEAEVPNLRSYLLTLLPQYMIPTQYIYLDKLPLTPNGKLDRKSLQEMKVKTISNSEGYIAPSNEIEKELVTIWKDILGLDKIGIEDNFFDLGGHSLKAVKIISEIQKKFNIKIEIISLFQKPHISELAALIANYSWQTEIVNEEKISDRITI